MYLNMRRISVALLFLYSGNAYAQDLTDNLKSWSGINLSYKVSESASVKLSQYFAFNISPVGYSFSQSELSFSYKLKRRTYIKGGYVRGLFNYSNSLNNQEATLAWFNTLAVDRVFGKFSYKHDIVRRVSLKHNIEFQYFLPDLNKYKTRTIYSTRLAYNVRKSSLVPYLESKFYYYQGGVILSNGMKRLRIKTGFSFRPVKASSMKISMYYLLQNEFNTEVLSDNDYAVLGSTVSFYLNR